MKKLLAIFLTVFFCLSAIGVEVTVHRCMGKVSYTVFGIDFNKHCKCKHEDESHKSRCCNTHTISFKAPQSPFTSPFKSISFQQVLIDKIFLKEQNLFSVPLLNTTRQTAFAHAPPERGTSLNTLFCVYRI